MLLPYTSIQSTTTPTHKSTPYNNDMTSQLKPFHDDLEATQLYIWLPMSINRLITKNPHS